jgi:hypothetical protein
MADCVTGAEFGEGHVMLKFHSIIIAVIVAVFSIPRAAHAITTTNEVFDFTGECTVDCAGQTATGILTLTSAYTLGTSITSDFVSFTYTRGSFSFTQTTTNLVSASGEITSLSGAEQVLIHGDNFYFSSATSGLWCVDNTAVCTPGTGNSADAGNDGSFSATPLPAALSLFGTGLGAMGLFGWRRKRKAPAIAA